MLGLLDVMLNLSARSVKFLLLPDEDEDEEEGVTSLESSNADCTRLRPISFSSQIPI